MATNHSPISELVYNLTSLLEEHNVQVGELLPAEKRNNEGYTDSSNVFCKVTRAGMPPTGLQRELWFVNNFNHCIPTFSPLNGKIAKIMDGNYERFASFWEWVPNIENIHLEELTPASGRLLAEGLDSIHQLDHRPFIPVLVANMFVYTFEQRLKFAKIYNPSKKHIQILHQLIQKFILEPNFKFDNLVVNHGDIHSGNIIVNNGSYHWTDFESVRLAPREWDLAGVSLMVRRYSDKEEVWEEFMTVLNKTRMVDYKLLEWFETLKTISSSTFLLQYPECYDLFEERVEALEPMLWGEKFPVKLRQHPQY